MNDADIAVRTEVLDALIRFLREIESLTENLASRANMTDFRVECLAIANDLEKMCTVTVRALESVAEIHNPEGSQLLEKKEQEP